MALTLVTGLPGHGKTLYTLQFVQNLAAREGRAVFYAGIKDLTLPWVAWEPEKWQDLEPGSIMVIDECQGAFPVRGRGQPPAWIEELAKHRHLGIDFVLITQNPMLMDSFVRRLVDRHFHVVRKFGTKFATIHEFPNGVKENVATSREGSIRHEWRYPSDLFTLYKSAELHTVQSRVPARVWVLAAIPFLLAGLAWFAWERLNPGTVAARSAAPASGPGAGLPAPGPGRAGRQGDGPQRDLIADHNPRVPGLAYTAPVYDEVTKAVEAPYPAACIKSGKRCQCYSQQGTRLDVPSAICEQIAVGGFFVAWKMPQQQQQAPRPAYAPATGNVVPASMSLGGTVAARSVPNPRP